MTSTIITKLLSTRIGIKVRVSRSNFIGDFLTPQMQHVSMDSYLGTEMTKLYDFQLAASKTFATEQRMFTFAKAID